METIDIVKLVGAIILGYAVLFFAMWLFRRGSKNSEDEKNKKKK
jgi:hypothetical protein